MNLLTNPNTPVFSLDIEATSLDAEKSKIYSVGVSGDKNYAKEFFQDGVIDKNTKPKKIIRGLINAHEEGGAGTFAKKQVKNKSFDPYKKAFESKTLSTMDETFTTITKDLKGKSGVMIIQNMNYESSQLGQAKNKQGAQNLSREVRANFLEGLFGIDPEYHADSNLLIPQDKRIIEARKSFDRSSELFKRAGKFSQDSNNKFAGRLRDSSDNFEKILNLVISENNAKDKLTPVELMDITKLYTAKLTLNGGLEAPYLNTGLSVEYLAESLLNDSEQHQALMDSKQQRLSYKIFSRRMDKINSRDELSKKDLEYGKNLMDSDVHDRTFIKNIENRLIEGTNGKKDFSEKDLNKALYKAVNNYSSIPEKANFNRLAFAEDIRQSFLKDPSEAFEKLGNIRESSLLPDIKPLSVADESPILRSGKSNNAKVLMGLTALGVVSMVGSNNRRSKKEEMTSYDDLYENVYLGQQYANWQERNNSNKMIY